MNIHAICLVKDEADIITQTLEATCSWCDYIYVFDNGSTDGTWEKVLQLAQKDPKVIPYKQDAQPFRNGLRAEVFNYYRTKSSTQDWWCILDADEIYIDNPRYFLSRLPQTYQIVWTASFQYYFTDQDWAQYQTNPELYADDIPIDQRIRYYINNWSEFRFFRYSEEVIWEETEARPTIPNGAIYPVRIWLKHYQYRSPQQIQARLNHRQKVIYKNEFIHEQQTDWTAKILDPSKYSSQPELEKISKTWHERIAPAAHLNYDDGSGKYIFQEDLMPKLPRNIWLEINLVQDQLKSIAKLFFQKIMIKLKLAS